MIASYPNNGSCYIFFLSNKNSFIPIFEIDTQSQLHWFNGIFFFNYTASRKKKYFTFSSAHFILTRSRSPWFFFLLMNRRKMSNRFIKCQHTHTKTLNERKNWRERRKKHQSLSNLTMLEKIQLQFLIYFWFFVSSFYCHFWIIWKFSWSIHI